MESKLKTCKIFEAEAFAKLIEGVQVTASMISDSPLHADEASIVLRAGQLSGEPSQEGGGAGNTCSGCKAGPFESRSAQTAHYRHRWHTHNLRRRLLGRPAISLLEYTKREDDGSSSSDSESDAEGVSGRGEREVSELFLAATRHCRAYFTNKHGQVLSVYRCLLHHSKESIGGDGDGTRWVAACNKLKDTGGWALIMSAGGHFAAAIFRGDGGVAIRHKTLHSYVTRRGQGKAQGTRDGKGGHAPRSAGASLRRYNQEQFAQHVQEVLTGWKEDLAACSLLLYRAVGPLNKAAIFGAGSPLKKGDPRLRTLPFPTRRPSHREVQRSFTILATVEVYDTIEAFQKSIETVYGSTPSSDRSSGRKVQKSSPVKLDRAKSREVTERPLPRGLPISSEDEMPTYHQNDLQPSKSSLKKGDGVSNLADDLKEINLRDNLKEFDCSMPNKGSKRRNKKSAKKDDGFDSKKSNVKSDDGKGAKRKDAGGEENKDGGEKKDGVEGRKREGKKGAASQLKKAVKATNSNVESAEAEIVPVIPDLLRQLWKSLESKDEGASTLLSSMECFPELPQFINLLDPFDGSTALHKATFAEMPNIVTRLLELGADPCIRNLLLQTPYEATSHQDTRIAFRLFRGANPDRYNYVKANIAGPLTLEMLEQEREKKAAQKREKRLKDKEKLAEKTHKNKFLELNDKEKIAAVGEKRCFSCGSQLDPKPFQYNDFKFCSVRCLQKHRNVRPLQLSKQ